MALARSVGQETGLLDPDGTVPEQHRRAATPIRGPGGRVPRAPDPRRWTKPAQHQRSIGTGERGGRGLGPNSLCTKNGLIRFSRVACSL